MARGGDWLDKITDAYRLFAEHRDGVLKVAIEP
jgi:hypothetical protein